MKQLHKARRTGRVSSNRRIMVKATVEMYAWAKPYTDSNIDNVVTGLGGNFRYSPIFKNTVADTFIELTGYREIKTTKLLRLKRVRNTHLRLLCGIMHGKKRRIISNAVS